MCVSHVHGTLLRVLNCWYFVCVRLPFDVEHSHVRVLRLHWHGAMQELNIGMDAITVCGVRLHLTPLKMQPGPASRGQKQFPPRHLLRLQNVFVAHPQPVNTAASPQCAVIEAGLYLVPPLKCFYITLPQLSAAIVAAVKKALFCQYGTPRRRRL